LLRLAAAPEMADPGADDAEFLVEDVETIVKSALQSVLNDTSYEQAKLDAWSNAVIDNCLKGLAGLGKPFKYVCSVILMQKTGAPLHTAAGAFWDKKKDGICKVPWENATMHAIVTIFGLSATPSKQETLE
jgi:dynein light chain Tctex-type 1